MHSIRSLTAVRRLILIRSRWGSATRILMAASITSIITHMRPPGTRIGIRTIRHRGNLRRRTMTRIRA